MNEIRIVVLGLLQRGELYGYQISKMLGDERFRDWLVVPVASLYSQLNRMAQEGIIVRAGLEAAEGRPARQIYRITPKGQEELVALLRQAWRQSGRRGTPQDIAAYFWDALPPEDLEQVLRGRLVDLQAEERRLRQMESNRLTAGAGGPAPESLRTVFDHLLARVSADIRWTEGVLARIGQPPPAPAPAPWVAGASQPRRSQGEGLGAFTFVLHSHLPYCRRAGVWPHGEEWIHEAAAETYVPLLNALYDLRDEGVDYGLTLTMTPVLCEQLADADIRAHFMVYLDNEIEASLKDIPRFGEAGDAHGEYLATFYRDYYRQVRESFVERFGSDIVGAFRTLQDEGYIEVVTCAATHGYLPLLSRDSSIYGQLRTGVESYRRHFGRSPRAIWLPECAYRPAYVDETGVLRPALEQFLAGLGITCFFVETHAIEGGRPVGKAAGDVAIGPYGAIRRKYVVPIAETAGPGGTTLRPYLVAGSEQGITDPPVSAIGRNNRTGQQVWSADWGYPGDADYREFHKKDHRSGLQYWRVTGPRVDLGDKDWYHPDWAAGKVAQHAEHFANLVEELLRGYREDAGGFGLIAANYDAELFGHWWFEGVEWIKGVLRRLAENEAVQVTTASAFLDSHPPEEVMAVPESSWGTGGGHWTWDNPETDWVWVPIREAERCMEALAERYPEADGPLCDALNQAARELLLLQSSDWPFLITTGQAREYAIERFRSHLERFEVLVQQVEAGAPDRGRARSAEFYELDKVFPTIDYRWFRARQGRAD